jgi:iron complex outermembrane receptor protein
MLVRPRSRGKPGSQMRFRFFVGFLLCPWSANLLASNDLASMELEQLMDMNVTTVSKREQKFNSAAAAIYTITQEDIRRTAATNLPEILAQAPGMEVARINPSMWAISARGFNNQFANKLLVLIDGRSIYTPLFSGVYWDAQMPPLDDIQRIEIIRGPGASLWGSNAVNGVINIITYDSEQTVGSHVVAGVGNEERGFARARHGFRNDTVSGRFNVQQRRVDEGVLSRGDVAGNDDYVATQTGTRLDWKPTTSDKFTLDLGITETDKHTDIDIPDNVEPLVSEREDLGAQAYYLMINGLHALDNGDAIFAQFYADHDNRYDPLNSAKRLTTDIEFQYNHQEITNHLVTWGITRRETKDDLKGSFVIYAEQPKQTYQINTAFLQDEYRITQSLSATAGIKLEDDNEHPVEEQPSLRLAWQATDNAIIWAAVSRATRTPSRLESSLEFRTSITEELADTLPEALDPYTPYSVALGSPDFESEHLKAYELGARWHANERLLVDATTFVNKYEELLTYLVLPQPPNPDIRYIDQGYVGIMGITDNYSEGKAKGFEMAVDYLVSERWKLKSTYTYFNFNSYNNPPNSISAAEGFELQSPENQARLTSYHTLADRWEFDWTIRYVDELFIGIVPAYTELDMRLGRQVTPDLIISLAGKNLLDPSKPEFGDANYGPRLTELQRSVFVQIDWRH